MTKMKKEDAIALINAFKDIDEPTEDEMAKKEEAVNVFITIAKGLKTDIKKPQLASLSKELSDMMDITKPPLKTTGTVDIILAEVVEAGTLLEKGDYLSDEAISILDQLGMRDFIVAASIEMPGNVEDFPPEEPEEIPEEEPVDEEAKVEYIHETPDMEPNDLDIDEEEPEPEDAVIEGAEVIEEIPRKGSVADINVDDLVEMLVEKGVRMRKSKARRDLSTPSSYKASFDIMCKYPDHTFKEICDMVLKETVIDSIDDDTRPGIRTAYSLVRKVVRILRENGNMPEQKIRKTTRKTTRKTAAKK